MTRPAIRVAVVDDAASVAATTAARKGPRPTQFLGPPAGSGVSVDWLRRNRSDAVVVDPLAPRPAFDGKAPDGLADRRRPARVRVRLEGAAS